MIAWAILLAAPLLMFTLAAGLLRVWRGPTLVDRMLAAQLFGTTGVAILLVLAFAMRIPALLDVALVFALLGAVTLVAFVRRLWRPPTRPRGLAE